MPSLQILKAIYLNTTSLVIHTEDPITIHIIMRFFTKREYEVIDKGVFWFSETPDIPVLVGMHLISGFVIAKFKELETNLEFYFFNVHFYWRNQTAKLNSGPLLLLRYKKSQETLHKFVLVILIHLPHPHRSMLYLLF